VRFRSAKRARLYRLERVPLVAAMLEESRACELGDRIWRVSASYRGCRGEAIGLHELRKRSAGGSLTNRANLLRCCGPCNSWVEDNPRLARNAGLVVRSADPEWDDLGAAER
jgi:hypothetical protein